MSKICRPAVGNFRTEARRLAAEGRWEEALEKHVWIHDHVLENHPSYYGVRLSYALSEWVELGAKYPKALERLKEIRENKALRLLSGERDRHLFHDVVAIDRTLGISPPTVVLFKQLKASSSDFAAQIFDLAEGAIVSAHEYELARE